MRPRLGRRLFASLLVSYLAVTLVALVVMGGLFAYMMHRYFFQVEGWELSARADRIIALLQGPMAEGDLSDISRRTETLAYSYNTRLWVIDEEGETIAAHGGGQRASGLVLDDLEMMHVLYGNILTKHIGGPEQNHLLHVKPVTSPGGDDDILGAVAVESPLGHTATTVAHLARLGLWAALPALILASVVGLSLSQRISTPVEEMSRVAGKVSEGDLDQRVREGWGDEMDLLAQTFNRAIEQIVSTVEERERLERLRKEFLSNTAHEFKAPLTTLRGFTELMLERDIDADEARRYLRLMLEDTLHLNRLVGDLIDLSSLESGDVSMRLCPLCPDQIVTRAAMQLGPHAAEEGIDLKVEVPADLPQVSGDPDRVHQVFLNLIQNALQHTPAGGRIEVTARRDDRSGWIRFAVLDSGRGIPDDELDLIWERFHKVDEARTRREPGTGLGLAIVREVIHRHGGETGVNSEVGQGSEFFFTLPEVAGSKTPSQGPGTG